MNNQAIYVPKFKTIEQFNLGFYRKSTTFNASIFKYVYSSKYQTVIFMTHRIFVLFTKISASDVESVGFRHQNTLKYAIALIVFGKCS